jgi:hypothetical protein
VSVSNDVCPAVTRVGLNEALAPAGTPVTPSVANWVNPLELVRLTANVTVWPPIKLAADGVTSRVKSVEVVMVSGDAETTGLPPTVTVMFPVAAPGGMTNMRVDADALATCASMVPPPCLFNVTLGFGARPFPAIVTRVPEGPDAGLKPLIVAPS